MASFKNNLFVLPDLGQYSIPGINYETGSCNVHAKLGPDLPLSTKIGLPLKTKKEINKQRLPSRAYSLVGFFVSGGLINKVFSDDREEGSRYHVTKFCVCASKTTSAKPYQ